MISKLVLALAVLIAGLTATWGRIDTRGWDPRDGDIAFSVSCCDMTEFYVLHASSGALTIAGDRDGFGVPLPLSPNGRRVVLPDGETVPLTTPARPVISAAQASLTTTAPAGDWVAFVVKQDYPGGDQLWISRPDGSDRKPVLACGPDQGCEDISDPVWGSAG